MNADRKRYRKRPYQLPRDKTPLSMALRQIGESIQRRDYPSALARAAALMADPHLDNPECSRVLSLVADSEHRRGRYAEAVRIHLRAAAQSIGHATLWLRPYIGQVRALLKMPAVEQALVMAHHAVAVAETQRAKFDEQVRMSRRNLETNLAVKVPMVPPRVSVVATRMGYLFLQEGEPEAAEEFFQKAIQASKGGANRARQGLAKIALARRDFPRAMEIAVEAIRAGGFKAKTLPAWETVIAARRQMGGWKISERLLKGLDSAPAGLRARTVLTIVRELRKGDMHQWREVAERWSAREGTQFPIVEAELRKMLLASAKAEPANATGKRERAEQLLKTPELSPSEWLAGSKELVRASLWEDRNVPIEPLLAQAKAKYGEDFVPKASHSLALSCLAAKRPDLARLLLLPNVQNLPTDNDQWGKSVWALARMESQLGDHSAAAKRYQQLFEEDSIPVRFRLQARLLWAEALLAAGQPDRLMEAKPAMESALAGIQDPDVLMNFARQIYVASPELEEWATAWFDRGVARALQRFQEATHPSVAIDILFRLTRRQVIDFDRGADAISFWEGLSDEKKDWLWTLRTSFWEYLGLLVRAYGMDGSSGQVESFARQWLQDPATPPVGRVHVGIPFGQCLVQGRRLSEALELFERLLAEAPTHDLCSLAWYWKALEAHARQDKPERDRCATCLRLASGARGGLMQEKELQAKSALLLADLDVARVDLQTIAYPPALLETIRLHILQDLKLLP